MKLPKSWKEITLKQYYLIDEILKDTEYDPMDRDIALLCYLTGETYEHILTLPLEKKRQIMNQIRFLRLLKMPMKLKRRFKVNGKYYHVPKFKTITGGQYMDIMEFCKNPEADTRDIHKILAVVCQPLKFGIFKTKYDGAKHKEIADAFLNMPVATAYPILVFFCNIYENLMPAMQDYLVNQVQKMKESLMQEQTTSTGTGGS